MRSARFDRSRSSRQFRRRNDIRDSIDARFKPLLLAHIQARAGQADDAEQAVLEQIESREMDVRLLAHRVHRYWSLDQRDEAGLSLIAVSTDERALLQKSIDNEDLIRWQDISHEPFADPDFVMNKASRLSVRTNPPATIAARLAVTNRNPACGSRKAT